MNDKRNTEFDFAVVGGGPAGTTTAIELVNLGRTVVLLESSCYETPRVGETLPPSVCPILIKLGLWESFQSLNSIKSCGIKSIWGDSNVLSNSFILSPYGSGWHVDRQCFDSMLANKASGAGVKVITGARVTQCVWQQPDRWKINFEVKKDAHYTGASHAPLGCFCTKGLIDATGRSSPIARQLGAKHMIYDRLFGVAVQFYTVSEVGAFALVEATEEGWWYSAPIPRNRLIVIFMTDLDLLTSNRPFGIAEWMKRLRATEHTSARCCGHSPIWGPFVLPALSQRLTMPIHDKIWLAAGDAALSVDPLSSGGIFQALSSGFNAASAIDRWLDGDPNAADIYENELDRQFNKYLHLRQAYYSMETRWFQSPFWKRRNKKPRI